MGDNGGSAGVFYEGKGSTWEGGIRMVSLFFLMHIFNVHLYFCIVACDSMVARSNFTGYTYKSSSLNHGFISYNACSYIAPHKQLTNVWSRSLSLAGISIPTDRVIDGLNITDTLLYGGPSPHDFLYFWNGRAGIFFSLLIQNIYWLWNLQYLN